MREMQSKRIFGAALARAGNQVLDPGDEPIVLVPPDSGAQACRATAPEHRVTTMPLTPVTRRHCSNCCVA